MDYSNIIETINTLNSYEKLTNNEANSIILKCFSMENLDAGRNVKHLFRYFIRAIIKTIKKEDSDDIFVKINNIYHKFGYNEATLDNFLSRDIRRFLKGEAYDKSIELIKISDDDKKDLTKKQSTKLIEKHSDMILFSKEYTLKLIRKLYTSENMHDKLICILLSSGSRPIEALFKSSYESITRNVIKHKNLAKKGKDSEECIKPLIELSCDEFIEIVKYTRDKYKEHYKNIIIADELKPGMLGSAGQLMKSYYKDIDVNLYSCRTIYAILSYDMFKETKIHGLNPSLNLWICACLGHKSLDISISYSKYAILENMKDVCGPDINSKFKKYDELILEVYNKNPEITMTLLTSGELRGQVPRDYVRRWYRQRKTEEMKNF